MSALMIMCLHEKSCSVPVVFLLRTLILTHTHTHSHIFLQENGLDAAELLTSGPYKELYRAKMITWGEERRNQDEGFFCRLACLSAARPPQPTWPVWVVADARRPSDVAYFQVICIACMKVEVIGVLGEVFVAGCEGLENASIISHPDTC